MKFTRSGGRSTPPLLVLWPYLSIFFPSEGNENCDNFGYFHSYEISSAFSDRIPMERKIEEKKQREKGIGFFSLVTFFVKGKTAYLLSLL